MSALRWAITGAGLGAIISMFQGRSSRGMAAEIADSTLQMGVIGAIVGMTEGTASQREHSLHTENIALKNTVNTLERKMSHVEQVVGDKKLGQVPQI